MRNIFIHKTLDRSIVFNYPKREKIVQEKIVVSPFNKKYLDSLEGYSKSAYLIKRVVDYIGAITLFLFTLPIMLYSIYRIKKESPGSIIFKQNRVGKDGEIFTCYKFRTMHENSYHDPYTRENDKRIFPWGKIMRKTRIDELPQLWNIIKGDMHLVGPRAEWDILSKEYEASISYYTKRFLVKPGITGWAQVNYHYGVGAEDAKEKLSYDLYYIKNWSLWLEIRTLIKTILVVLQEKGL